MSDLKTDLTASEDNEASECKNLLCVFCSNFDLDMGSPGYSELTPGYSGSISCTKGRWSMSTYGDADEYRDYIKMAVNCNDYKQVDT